MDRNYKLDTSAYTAGLPVGGTGTGLTWDFTKVFGMFPVITDSVLNPAAAASSTAYPGATYCQRRDQVYSFYKSASSPQQTELLGVYSPSLSFTFTNSAIIATYPVAYGYSQVDVVSGTAKSGANNGVCNGSITVTADGVGTLNFPNNVTFTNVLRLRSVEELTITSGFIPLGTIRQNFYSFYVPGKKYPILSVQYQTYQLLAGTPTITALAYGNFDYFTVAGISEQQNLSSSVRIYPNPVSGELHLDPDQQTIVSVRIYQADGTQVKEFKQQEILEVSDLSPGMYQVEIMTEKGSLYRKLVKD